MHKKIFVDTSAWYSLVDQDAENHQTAVRFLKESKIPFVTSDYILDETLTLIRTAISHKVAVEFLDGLIKSRWAGVIHLSIQDKENAVLLFRRYSDKDFSFTDCTSFILMKRLRINESFTFDKHFRQMGFVTVS